MENPTNPPATSKSAVLLNDLSGLLTFNPVKEERVSTDTFSAILQEIQEERQKKAAERARVLIQQAMNEAQEFAKIQKAYQDAEAKHAKNFAKTVNKIKALANGQPEPVEQEGEKTEG